MRIVDIILTLAGAAGLAGGIYVFANPPQAGEAAVAEAPSLPLVETALVEVASITPSVRQTALLQPSAEVAVTSAATGRVAWIKPDFRLGARIGAGADVLWLYPARLETDVARAEAELAIAQAELARLEEEFARTSALVERNVSSAATLTTTRSSLSAAEARLALARAALRGAEIALDDATVRAPFPSVVAAEAVSSGQFLSAGTEVGRLVAADQAELVVQLNASQLAALGPADTLVGRAVTVRATDGSGAEKPGLIDRVALTSETATQTTAVIVSVADPFGGAGGCVPAEHAV